MAKLPVNILANYEANERKKLCLGKYKKFRQLNTKRLALGADLR
jgi:hypothetical protein